MPVTTVQWVWFLFFAGGAFAGWAALAAVVLDVAGNARRGG